LPTPIAIPERIQSPQDRIQTVANNPELLRIGIWIQPLFILVLSQSLWMHIV
jgi:hypothetical protein